ncbi:hepatic leukemia factor isoform X5 [Macaca fascicularis]|uniref:hepatic leukemia factor isoform X5 n=1 Tax=Macaca fascicularis TaxID=9541 RepID=UPI003D15DB71
MLVKDLMGEQYFQHLVKIKTRKRSWMMRVTARRSPSRHSWGLPYGTKPFPMTEILSSWNTWTWRSFCQKMAFPPAHLSMTTALTLPGCSQLPRLPPRSWTSAAGPLHPFTLASHLRTVCRAPSDQCPGTKVIQLNVAVVPVRSPFLPRATLFSCKISKQSQDRLGHRN